MPIRGALMCIGGPALVIYVTPTEEELFKVSHLSGTGARTDQNDV